MSQKLSLRAQQPHTKHDSTGALGTAIRIGVIALCILAQLALLLALTFLLSKYAVFLYGALAVVSMLTLFKLVNRHGSSAFRLAWVVILLVLPILGVLLYFAWGRVDFNRLERGTLNRAFDRGFSLLPENADTLEAFSAAYPEQAGIVRSLQSNRYPVYDGTSATYFPSGEAFFERLIADLESARQFIFIEFFIVGAGTLWDRVHALLRRKMEEGVEVRLLYDDVGCFFKIPDKYDHVLRKEGFKVCVFNPAHRFIASLYLNYRNHQKIVIVDGKVGYTGGINLADEYINVGSKLGHWKDVGARFEGLAVRSLSVTFLQMWNVANHTPDREDAGYLREERVEGAGYYQPYADGPANDPRNPALDLFYEAAGGARQYLWITTPYLAIDQELLASFCRAARSGVDVRIVTPAVCDHFYVGFVNRHNYRYLVQNGVKIYEYTPGFIHAKLMVWDDVCATVGTVNLDFRSLYLHYENGVFTCGSPLVSDIREDIAQTIARSREITMEELEQQPLWKRLLGALFNLFSPLM